MGESRERSYKSPSLAVDRRTLLSGAATLGAVNLLPTTMARAAAPADAVRLTGAFPQRKLLKADISRLLDHRNLSKLVHDRIVVDDMEHDGGWFASDVVTLNYTTDRFRDGSRSMRFRTELRNEKYIQAARAKNGSFTGSGVLFAGMPFSAFISKRFSPAQDWSRFNRISLWCYVHPTDNLVNTLSVQFLCEGAAAGPLDPVSLHYFGDLKPGAWNYLVWEIPEHKRDRISQIVIFQPLSGVSVAGAQSEIIYDFDQLAVERVDAERVTGWTVTPGKIAYSHIGYQPSAEKLALAPLGSDSFSLLNATTGAMVATLPAKALHNRRGDYHVLDFSSFAKPGTYRLRHGETTSAPFAIDEAAWRPMIEATLNAYYGLRCGFAVDGVHDACHLDVYVEHKGERRVIGGGWHDAANLTQSPYRTHLSIYALMELHDALIRQGEKALAERALEEARWGLEWSLRCRFGPGLRVLYGEYSYWTDSRPGTMDDVVQEEERAGVGKDPFQNTLSALVAARAARMFMSRDSKLAKLLTKVAREDFASVAAAITAPTEAPPLEINVPSWRDQVGYLTLCAAELHQATGDVQYIAQATRFARWLTQTQERRFVHDIPVAGYFYEDAGRTRIVHEYHNSFEDSGLLAFAKLCEQFPNHDDWISWYSGLVIYADHFCAAGSSAAGPFKVIPAAVWRRSDIDAPLPPDKTGERLAKSGPTPVFPTAPTPELIHAQMTRMFEDGADLGHDYRLRVFPLWFDHIRHGATTVHMSKTIGLGIAAKAMGRADLSDLTARQLQWTVGANPLSRSLIYGLGHDFWQNFTAAMPNLVGGMSLGFNSYEADAPAWGNNAAFPYKEMWVYSSCRMALNLARVGAPAKVMGHATIGARFRNLRTGAVNELKPGPYNIFLPAGEYEVRYGRAVRNLVLAHAEERLVDLNPVTTISMSLDVAQKYGSTVELRLHLSGAGAHTLRARVFNGVLTGLPERIQLDSHDPKIIVLKLDVVDVEGMWLVAIVPDTKLHDRAEISGSLRNLAEIS